MIRVFKTFYKVAEYGYDKFRWDKYSVKNLSVKMTSVKLISVGFQRLTEYTVKTQLEMKRVWKKHI